MTRTHHRLTGQMRVALPPQEAYRLFTPSGEQDWAEGWQPHYPASASHDSAPGTVFQTDAHGQTTTWIVTDTAPGRSIRYARLIPDLDAGTVTVTVEPTPGGTLAAVSYELTALSAAGDDHLRDFAARYPEFLQSWQDAIEAWLVPQPSTASASPDHRHARVSSG